jgi:hypothetical protein
MAVQFPCPSCSQPIEVDDEYAGGSAACPYCRRVVNVPRESTADLRPATMARPTPTTGVAEPAAGASDAEQPREIRPAVPPPPPPGSLHIGPLPAKRDRTASTYGTYALICTLLVILLFGSTLVYAVGVFMNELGTSATSRPTPEEMGRAQAAATEKIYQSSWVAGVSMGALFFAVVGLALGIASLRAGSRPNWKAVVSLTVCGMLAICNCGNLLSSLGGWAISSPASPTS